MKDVVRFKDKEEGSSVDFTTYTEDQKLKVLVGFDDPDQFGTGVLLSRKKVVKLYAWLADYLRRTSAEGIDGL